MVSVDCGLLVSCENGKTGAEIRRIGKGRHVMAYSIAGGKSFNMVLSHPEHSDPSTWNQETVLEDMKRHFEGWDPW